MAVCLASNLLTAAEASGFLGVASNPVMSGAVALQLLSNTTGNTQSASEILATACESNFPCVATPGMTGAIAIQLVCNALNG